MLQSLPFPSAKRLGSVLVRIAPRSVGRRTSRIRQVELVDVDSDVDVDVDGDGDGGDGGELAQKNSLKSVKGGKTSSQGQRELDANSDYLESGDSRPWRSRSRRRRMVHLRTTL